MSKLIQKASFLNPKCAGRYMNYIATRDGVELLDENADSIYMRYSHWQRVFFPENPAPQLRNSWKQPIRSMPLQR